MGDYESDRPFDGIGFGYGMRITYKRPENPMACIIGQANSATQWYRCKLTTQAQIDAYANLGVNLDSATATVNVTTRQWDSLRIQNELDCRRKCGGSMQCWGFLYNADTKVCMYKGGSDGVGNWLTYFI